MAPNRSNQSKPYRPPLQMQRPYAFTSSSSSGSNSSLWGMERPIPPAPAYQAFVKAAAPVPTPQRLLPSSALSSVRRRASSIYSCNLDSVYVVEEPRSALPQKDLFLQPSAFSRSTSQLPDRYTKTPPSLEPKFYSTSSSSLGSIERLSFPNEKTILSQKACSPSLKLSNGPFPPETSSLNNHSFTSSSVSIPEIDFLPPPEAYRESQFSPPDDMFASSPIDDAEYMDMPVLSPADPAKFRRTSSRIANLGSLPPAHNLDDYQDSPMSSPQDDCTVQIPLHLFRTHTRNPSQVFRFPTPPPTQTLTQKANLIVETNAQSSPQAQLQSHPPPQDYHQIPADEAHAEQATSMFPMPPTPRSKSLVPAPLVFSKKHKRNGSSISSILSSSSRHSRKSSATSPLTSPTTPSFTAKTWKPPLPVISRGQDGKYDMSSVESTPATSPTTMTAFAPPTPPTSVPSALYPNLPIIHRGPDGRHIAPSPTNITSTPASASKATHALPTIHPGPDGKYRLAKSTASNPDIASTLPPASTVPPGTIETKPHRRTSSDSSWLTALKKATAFPSRTSKPPSTASTSTTLEKPSRIAATTTTSPPSTRSPAAPPPKRGRKLPFSNFHYRRRASTEEKDLEERGGRVVPRPAPSEAHVERLERAVRAARQEIEAVRRGELEGVEWLAGTL